MTGRALPDSSGDPGQRGRGRLEGQAHEEGGALAGAGLERQRAAVALHHHGARDGEALAGAAAELLGGEERVEDARLNRGGNAAAVVADRDDDSVALAPALHGDAAA